MSIWQKNYDLEYLNDDSTTELHANLGIRIAEIGADYLAGQMPVDQRTIQPFGILHGGASCVLAESLGSIGANMCIADKSKIAVGMSLNASYMRQVPSGEMVYALAKPLHLGQKSQIWQIKLRNANDKPTGIVILTMAVIDAKA